jgi:hypothetical protein
METSSIIDKLKSFLDDEGIKVDTDVLSTSLRELNFTQTLSLLDNLKVNDRKAVLDLLNINHDAPAEEEQINEIDPSRSPWTQNGKHPGAMDADELRDELAVFDELRDRGDYLSPKELAQEDSLWHYLEQIDGPQVDEAYGSVGTQQPSASTIKAQTTKDNNNQRDFTNNQQDQQRDSTVVSRTVAGGNKQATGQGAARSVGADPDDVQRGQNAAQSNANAQLSDQNAQEIERLKQLAYGRR